MKKITAEKKTAGKKARAASSKKLALSMKKAGKGIFAPKKLRCRRAVIGCIENASTVHCLEIHEKKFKDVHVSDSRATCSRF